MEGKERKALTECLRDLEILYSSKDEQQMKSILNSTFEITGLDAYSLVLGIIKDASYQVGSQRKSIAEVTLIEFKLWLETKRYPPPTQRHKDDAMFHLVTSGLIFIDLLKDIYQLDKGDDRAYLAAHLKYIYYSKNDPKTAANVAVKLNLQNFVEPEDLLLPLIAADKFQVIEDLLKGSPKLQNEYAKILCNLCGMQGSDVLDYIQNKRRLRIVDKTKFQGKTLQKISEKVIKKYNLDAANFPEVFREKNVRSIRHVLNNRYKSPPKEYPKWDGNIEAAVGRDSWLQKKLILMIAYDFHDIPNAAYWARKLDLPKDDLPQSVRKELEDNPAGSFQGNTSIPPLIDFYDDDYDDFGDDHDGGFMFASDDVTYDEKIEAKNSVDFSQPADQYWSYPLPDENLKFVDTCEDLESCIKFVFKPGSVIGFDSEWLPNYGRAGQKERIAILQLAVKEMVFLVDVITFSQTDEGQKILKDLFRKLFTSENTLRLGFGIESDKNLIIENFPYAQTFLDASQHFDDLKDISKQIMKIPCVMKKLNIEKLVQGTERGLSFLVKQCFGKPLDKTYQVSNWEQRPLSKEQLRYAALDALCLIKIYDVFEDLTAEFQIIKSKNGLSCNGSGDSQTPIYEECVISGPPKRPGQLKVVCDTMLQGLGRILRCCGVDTIVLQNGEDHMKAVEYYYKDKRVILTKGRPFYQIRGCVPEHMCMAIPEGEPEVQLSAIFQRYNIRVSSKDIFSRCQICNCDSYKQVRKEHMMLAYWIKNRIRPNEEFMRKYNLHPLRGSSGNDIGIDFKHITLFSGVPLKCEFVPLSVFNKTDIFFVCTNCGKVYWEGSHFDKVAERFANLIMDDNEQPMINAEANP